jgi:murein DD-endopeptidase MepM/ murein hydrolase activator NlpD
LRVRQRDDGGTERRGDGTTARPDPQPAWNDAAGDAAIRGAWSVDEIRRRKGPLRDSRRWRSQSAHEPPPRRLSGALRRLGVRAALVLWLALLVFGATVTPRAMGDLFGHDDLPDARVTRERIGQRLVSLRDRFLLLAQDVDEERRRVEKIRLTYGLPRSQPQLPEGEVDPRSFPSSVFLPMIDETATLATHARIAVVELEARVAALRAFESGSPERVALTPALSPLEGDFVMISPFGYRKSTFTEKQEYHAGVDLAAAIGTPVIAPADGRVVFAGQFPVTPGSGWWKLGNVIVVRHGGDLLTLYGHLGRIFVRPGQTVARGDRMSEIGESGVIANPHLHYAVWRRQSDDDYAPLDSRLFMLDRRWDDEEKLLAESGAKPGEYEPLPRQLR